MKTETDKRKRKFVFTPFFGDTSTEAFWKLKKAFMVSYPSSSGLEESIHGLFFSLLADGVLPTTSPVNSFYSIKIDQIDVKSGTLRIPRKNYVAGNMIYLSSLSQTCLVYYLRQRDTVIDAASRKELVLSEFLHKKVFYKKFRLWLKELADRADVCIAPSVAELVRMRELFLFDIYPPFVAAALCNKISYSIFSTGSFKRINRQRIYTADSGIAILPVDEYNEPCLNVADIFEKHKDLCDFSSRLNQFTSRQECQSMMHALATALKSSLAPKNIDEMNYIILASWFHNMLSVLRVPNTIRTYFSQVSYLLRTELLGQSIDGFSQPDAENIFENYSHGKTSVLIAALKNFLDFACKSYGIRTGKISWQSLSKQKNLKDTLVLWPSDFEKILSCGSDEQRIAVIFGVYCGMRIGEIAGLSLGDFLMSGESSLYIRRAKTNSGRRWLPLWLLFPPRIHSYISSFYYNRLAAACFDNSKPLLANSDGQPFTNPQLISNGIQKIFKMLGYGGATFHTLRHTFASILLLRWYRTVDPTCKFFLGDRLINLDDFELDNDRALLSHGLPDIARLMGHADIKTTVRNYIHTTPLIQKAYLDKYELTDPFRLPNSKAMILTGLSKPGFYKQFSPQKDPNNKERPGVPAKIIATYMKKKYKQR